MKNSFLPLALVVLTPAALGAAPPQARSSISTLQIAAAITGAGMDTSPAQVTLLSDVMATSPAPVLRVESMQPWGEHRMKVRMRCASSEQCLPFFVAVSRSASGAAQSATAASDPAANLNAAGRPEAKNYTVHAGSAATLLLEGAHVHIRIAVVCLENGAPGQIIRVASKDHRQTYTAQVADGAFVRASL